LHGSPPQANNCIAPRISDGLLKVFYHDFRGLQSALFANQFEILALLEFLPFELLNNQVTNAQSLSTTDRHGLTPTTTLPGGAA
jgi:hypothetical protein